MPRSRHDELHDHYRSILSKKRGTRYEILAAVVFAAYEDDAIVIHDMRMLGDSEAKHQIDVTVERNGKEFRALIECKDFDVSGDPVGLGIVRDFYGTVSDIHPDAAWIVTCNDFTKDARAFAKAKGIRLATLRLFRDEDWFNGKRVNTIVVSLNIISAVPELIFKVVMRNLGDEKIVLDALAHLQQRSISLDEPSGLHLFNGETTRTISEILKQLQEIQILPGAKEHVERRDALSDAWFSPNAEDRYPIVSYEIGFPVHVHTIEMKIEALRSAARLLLLDDDGLDFIVWDDTLATYSIEDDGRVIVAPANIEQRVSTTLTDLTPAPPAF